MDNLDKEYVKKYTIYQQQKEYRKTEAGKLALRRAKEKQFLKQMKAISKNNGGGSLPNCKICGEIMFEVLTIDDDKVVCYNCKYQRPSVLSEDELCQ